MILQYLNGIDAGSATACGVRCAPPRQVAGLFDNGGAGLQAMKAYQSTVDDLTDGTALDGYTGVNGVEDIELIRNYLLKTKKAVDAVPQLVQTYVNPEEFSNMLDYVLRYWDTEQRETACSLMATRERKLIASGKVQTDDSDTSGGFFTALYAVVRPQTEMAEAAEELLKTYKGKLRNAVAQMRANGHIDCDVLSGFGGVDDYDVTTALYGWEWHVVEGLSGESGVAAVAPESNRVYAENYLRTLHSLVSSRPGDFCATEAEGQQLANALGVIIANIDNGNLDAILAKMEQEGQLSGKLRKKLKKLASKVKSAVKTAAKTVAKGVTTAAKATAKATTKAAKTVAKGVKTAVKSVGKAFKKVGKAIAKVTKKVVKFLIRFNPLTAAVRGILILAARFNWFKLAERSYPGTLTQAQAISQLKVTADYWKKSCEVYKKFANIYTKIGGKESKLKSALEKGKSKKWKGGNITSTSVVSKSSVKKLKDEAGGDKVLDAETEDEIKTVEQVTAKGKKAVLKEDSTLSVGTSKTEQQTVTQTVNEYETTQATSFYLETATDKVASTIAKGTKLIVDCNTSGTPIAYSQTGETTGTGLNFYRVQYNGKYGIVPKTCLKQTTLTLSGVSSPTSRNLPALYIEADHQLGWVQAVAAIASAVSCLATIVAMMLKAFGNDKAANVASTVAAGTAVVAAGAGIVSAVQSAKADNSAKTTTSSSSGSTSKVQAVADKVSNVANKASDVTNKVSSAATTISNAASGSSNKLLNKVSSIASNVANTATKAGNVTTTVSNVANSITNAGTTADKINAITTTAANTAANVVSRVASKAAGNSGNYTVVTPSSTTASNVANIVANQTAAATAANVTAQQATKSSNILKYVGFGAAAIALAAIVVRISK